MLKEPLIQFFSKHSAVFFEKYALATTKADVEAIHDIRVSLKRIHSLLNLLNYNKKANFLLKHSFKPLKKLFKESGPVRDIQVQVQLISDFRQVFFVDEKLCSLIIQTKDEKLKNYFNFANSFNLFEAKRSFQTIHRYLEILIDVDIARQIDLFETSRYKLINQYINQQSPDFNLHNARKMVKDLAYINEMIMKEKHTEYSGHAKLKLLGQILGEWHDRAILHNFLNEIITRKQDKLYSEFNILNIRVKEDKENLKNKFYEIYYT